MSPIEFDTTAVHNAPNRGENGAKSSRFYGGPGAMSTLWYISVKKEVISRLILCWQHIENT
jgi:hypothetical protein